MDRCIHSSSHSFIHASVNRRGVFDCSVAEKVVLTSNMSGFPTAWLLHTVHSNPRQGAQEERRRVGEERKGQAHWHTGRQPLRLEPKHGAMRWCRAGCASRQCTAPLWGGWGGGVGHPLPRHCLQRVTAEPLARHAARRHRSPQLLTHHSLSRSLDHSLIR